MTAALKLRPIDLIIEDVEKGPPSMFTPHIGLMRWAARRYWRDLPQENRAAALSYALTVVEKRYDPTKSKFSTYFVGACMFARARQWKEVVRDKKHAALERIADTMHPVAHSDAHERVEAVEAVGMLDRLPPHYARVVRLRLGLGGQAPMTFREIGVLDSKSRQCVEEMYRRALKRLRACYE